jgi:cobalamin biosynthesis Mg chelatase CobN
LHIQAREILDASSGSLSMDLILIVLVVVLLFGGGGYWGRRRGHW